MGTVELSVLMVCFPTWMLNNMGINGKIALAGGGGAEDSHLLDEIFASWIGPRGKLLYWPFALRGLRPYQACFDWITSVFMPLNITDITMWTDLSDYQACDLEEFDAVYIGGGNTFSLLAQVKESGFDRSLNSFLTEGKAIYGGSAGAAILGRDIRTVSHLDSNDLGIGDTKGLNLANGYAIWVHYQLSDDKFIDAYIRKHRHPVLAISERSGIVIESTGLRAVGFEPAYRFDGRIKSEVKGGA
jgi:dipeptidase E